MADLDKEFESFQDLDAEFDALPGEQSKSAPVDLSYAPEARDYTATEAAGLSLQGTPTGLPQGLTLGFGDEIGALSGTLGATTGGDPRSFADIYRNIRDTLREEGKAAEEQQPMAALAGELVGGLAVPIGVGGAAAKTGMTAAKIKQGRDVVKAGSAAVKEARVLRELGKIGEMAKTGAKAGALAGLGGSEADLVAGEPGQFAEASKDVIAGAGLGAGVGAGLQTVGAGIKLAGKGFASLPYVEDAARIRELAKQGYSMAGETKNISQEARDHAYNILSKLESLRTFTGTLVGKSREEADKIIGKVKIDDAINNIRRQINELKPIGSAEREDVNNLKEVLSDILGETEKVHYKYIPKGKLPKASIVEKAEQKVAKKTAEAEMKDSIKIRELESKLQEGIEAGASDEDLAPLYEKISKLQGETQYPGTFQQEELTELPVLGVSRGTQKSPIVEAVLPEPESVFTPIQRVEVGRDILPTKLESTPGELSSHLQSIRDVPTQTAKGQRALGIAQEGLRTAEQQAAKDAGEAGQQAVTGLKEAGESFGAIKDIQKSLGLPESGKAFNPAQEKNIIDGLQRAILGLTENKISSDRFMELTDELSKQFPAAASEIKQMSKSISDRYQLSQMMSSQSLEGVKRGGLAIPAMMGRAAEYGTRAEQAVKKAVTGTIKGAGGELVNLGKRVHDASPDQIQRLAAIAAQKGTAFGQTTANTLSKLINAPMAKRRAVLFTLMQQPDFRQFAKDTFESEPEE